MDSSARNATAAPAAAELSRKQERKLRVLLLQIEEKLDYIQVDIVRMEEFMLIAKAKLTEAKKLLES